MGWEYRASGGPYYIRYSKRNGQEGREYFGRGPAAERADESRIFLVPPIDKIAYYGLRG